jgi:hypothetical protein
METRKQHISTGFLWILISICLGIVIQLFVSDKAMFIPAFPPFIYGLVELLQGIFRPDLKSN